MPCVGSVGANPQPVYHTFHFHLHSLVETLAHHNLKRLAAAFLYDDGYLAVGTEVRCPGSRYRVDVAGYRDRTPWPREQTKDGSPTLWSTANTTMNRRKQLDRKCEPKTIIIECKQSRSDFIRDDRSADDLIALRRELDGWQTHLEENCIKVIEPKLRISGSALFPGMEVWDFNSSRLASYRKLLRRIRKIEKQLYGETKFCLMHRYRLADHLFLATPRGMVHKCDVPTGWGLFEFPREALRDQTSQSIVPPRITLEAPPIISHESQRLQMLRNIAVAATRDTMRSQKPMQSTTRQPPLPHEKSVNHQT